MGRGRPRRLGAHSAPGEAARLLGSDTGAVQADRFAAVESLAARYGGTALLKGLGTLVRGAEGTALISDGNPGMGSGGMGTCSPA